MISTSTSKKPVSKADVQRAVKDAIELSGERLTRIQMWEIFLNVCDNLLKQGTITNKQHTSWTSPF